MSEVIYKKCPKCGATMVRDDEIVYTSLPPQYRYTCPKCGEVEFDTEPPQGFPTIKVEPDIIEPAPFPLGFTWDEYRREVAKDILCAMVGGGYGRGREEEQAHLAVQYADELIKALREEKK